MAIRNLIKTSLFTPLSGGRWGLPILLWGQPGTGKTSLIEECCREFGLACETLSPSERGEGAFGVVPVPADSPNGMTLLYPRPDWCAKFDQDGRGVVFVDEMSSVPPALSAPLMGLVLARRVGGYTLPKGVRAIGAANPPEQAANGYDLPPPLANRFGHIDIGALSVEDHAAFMVRGESTEEAAMGTGAAEEEARVMRAWPNFWSKSVGAEVAYLQRFKVQKNKMPKLDDPKAGRAWPSDRSWEAATRADASAFVHGLTDMEREELVSGFIGAGVASEWFHWREEQDMPDAAKVLDGTEQWKHEPRRMDRTCGLFAACAALVTPEKAEKRKDRTQAFWEVLGEFLKNGKDKDVCVTSVRALVNANLHEPGISGAAGKKVLTAINPMLVKANITQGDLG